MLDWIFNWWRRRQRKVDMEILWPSIRSQSQNLSRAKLAFRMHINMDPAWQDLSDDEIENVMEKLH